VGVSLRLSMNAISDVVVNRPPALREFDQIYMRAGEMLMHVDHVCEWFDDRNVVFIGDGDAMALCLVHLHASGLVNCGPRSVHILDFDERMIGSVNRFAKVHGYEDRIKASYYNVRDALPSEFIGAFDAVHTNPPFGKSNGGTSVDVFLRRGMEACGNDCRVCVVLADDDKLPWTQEVLAHVQQGAIAGGFMVTELRPKAHKYHIDDVPDLTSCTMLLKRHEIRGGPTRSRALSQDECQNFYGKNLPLTVAKIRDRTAAGRLPSRDHEIIPFEEVR
jgi:N4-bis(aminopropyl)spermidine synthase